MTWTYDEPTEDGFADPIHEVRYLLADTHRQTAQSPSDEVLRMLLNRYTDDKGQDVYAAAATAATAMAREYTSAGMVTKSTGNTSLSRQYSGESSRYSDLAKWLWGQARFGRDDGTQAMGSFGIVSGRRQPERSFAIGQMDTPGIPSGPETTTFEELERHL